MPRVNNHIDDDEPYPIVKVKKDKTDARLAYAIDSNATKVLVHYFNTNIRLDEWVNISATEPVLEPPPDAPPPPPRRSNKRKRAGANGRAFGRSGHIDSSDDEDSEERQAQTGRRNFDHVVFGDMQIDTWYYSPYPITDEESDGTINANPASQNSRTQSPDVLQAPAPKARKLNQGYRTTPRSHGRTADMLAGGLTRHTTRERGEAVPLWVCDRCFKYMTAALPYELHIKTCERPIPGKLVYQNANYGIYEIDGAIEKLFCQNLSLFGKLFINEKTIFFDLENFLFYVLVEIGPKRNNVLGYFSKEKISADKYNLACIAIWPQYQRHGHGRSLIEFSYLLSRAAKTVGSPETPLSDLGSRSYVSYWISALVRFYRSVLQISNVESLQFGGKPAVEASTFEPPTHAKGKKKEETRGRKKDDRAQEFSVASYDHLRRATFSYNPDGSAILHVDAYPTLREIANATAIRMEDISFALKECELLEHHKQTDPESTFMISRAMVEEVAKKYKVRAKGIIDPAKFRPEGYPHPV